MVAGDSRADRAAGGAPPEVGRQEGDRRDYTRETGGYLPTHFLLNIRKKKAYKKERRYARITPFSFCFERMVFLLSRGFLA